MLWVWLVLLFSDVQSQTEENLNGLMMLWVRVVEQLVLFLTNISCNKQLARVNSTVAVSGTHKHKKHQN